MSRIVNTSSHTGHERSRGRASQTWDLGLIFISGGRNSRISEYNISMSRIGSTYPRQAFDRSSWDLRNPAAAGLTAFTSTPCLRPRLATWFADNTMTFSYLRTLSTLSFNARKRNWGSIVRLIVGSKFTSTNAARSAANCLIISMYVHKRVDITHNNK